MAADARRYLLAGKGSIQSRQHGKATWQTDQSDQSDQTDQTAVHVQCDTCIIISIQQLRQRWHERLAGLQWSARPSRARPCSR